MDRERFMLALEAASARERGGIGTLGEKGVHNTLKHYYEPDPACHEIPIGGFVADIVGESGIIEIQTGSFYKMKEKLLCFLAAAHVTIVWPCVVNKRIIRVDSSTGEAVSIRRSTVHRGEYDIFRELYGIREFLTDPSLSICIAQLEADEYRPADEAKGRGRRKRGAYNGVERYPTMLAGEVLLECPDDYLRFLPTGLPETYTVKEFAAVSSLYEDTARSVLNVLCAVGIVERSGKSGKAFVYRTANQYCTEQNHTTPRSGAAGRFIDISLLDQPLDGLDGQMCVAMAAGVPISEVITKSGCGRWKMNSKRLIETLDLFSMPHAEKMTPVRSRPVSIPDFCIISEHGHFLLHYRGTFYDNSVGVFQTYSGERMTGYIELYENLSAAPLDTVDKPTEM